MQKTPSIADVDRLDDGVVVSFTDGISAFYPSAVLYAILDRAELMNSSEPTPEE
jgi:hypothetical protein